MTFGGFLLRWLLAASVPLIDIQLSNADTDCGTPAIPPVIVESKIVGGTEAVPHSWPWQVALLQEQFSLGLFTQTCGGTLITDQWVLSAGHCLFRDVGSPGKYRVKLGAHKLGRGGYPDLSELRQQQVIDASAIYIHPKYNPKSLAFDISLMKLNMPAKKTEFVSPICLPSSNSFAQTGQMAVVTGWGTLDYEGDRPSTLQQVSIPIVDQSICENSYKTDVLVDESMFCAGYIQVGKDSCQGDSGGPLVTMENDRWVLRGVISQGEKCAEANYPGIYANLTMGLAWIQNIIKNY